MAYNPNNPNGQATMANSAPVVIASDQSAISVTGTFYQPTQPVSGTVAATQSGTWNLTNISGTISLPTGAATETTLSTLNGKIPSNLTVSSTRLLVDGSGVTQPISGTIAATQSGVWSVGLDAGTNAIGSITNTSFAATQATAANLNATVVGTGTFAVQAAQSGTWILGANSGVDIGDVTINNAAGASAVNIQDGGNTITVDGTVAATQSGTWNIGTLTSITNTVTVSGTVTASNTAGDVAHDSPDSGNPVKIGFQGETTLPTAVANGDRANGISDRYGRQLIAHIDPSMQTWKSAEYTSTQTGTNIWVPTSGNRFIITSLHITTGGTTAGLVTIWGAQTGTTAYVAGTDQVFFRGSLTPTANATPGAIIQPFHPFYSDTVNDCLKITTSANMTIYIQVNGYEITP
jgi:hypothetical protein